MAAPTLIYCGGSNPRFYEIATQAGFEYGSQLPRTVYGPLYFADQDWKRPERRRYMAALARHRPVMATVLDWERDEQLPEILDWAEEAAQHVDQVLIIPKVLGGIVNLPRRIGGKDVVLAYSVPTRFGHTPVPQWEFWGWPVHLLGGSPHQQIQVWRYMSMKSNVVSVDGNGFQRKATVYCEHWQPPGRWVPDGQREQPGGPERAFAQSVENIIAFWRLTTGETRRLSRNEVS